MLALYVRMKSREHKQRKKYQEIINYYLEIRECISSRNRKLPQQCRVCLQEGSTNVIEDKNKDDVLEALQVFGNINLTEESDSFPKHLCPICFRFIQEAILFRKTVALSDSILRDPVKSLSPYVLQSDNRNFSDSEEFPNGDCDIPPNSLNDHDKTKTQKKTKEKSKIKCKICNKIMDSSYYHSTHKSIHDPNTSDNYICEMCGKTFRTSCAYHNHKLRHNPNFTFKCQFCPYKARCRDLLRNHLKSHGGEKKYMCTECPKRFLHRGNLNSHMYQHREPEFKCDSCTKAFHTKFRLHKHFEVDHLGIKNHVCNLCGKLFGYRSDMMKHQLGVHKRQKLTSGRVPAYIQAERQNVTLQNS